MKKINYVYYIFLIIILCVIVKYSNYIEDKFGTDGFYGLVFLYEIYLICSQFVFYLMVRKKGVKDNFCITYQCNFEWSTFWVDTIHNELACLCMFNPFKIQYVSMNRVHGADIKIKYCSAEQYIDYLNIHFYIDGKKNTFRIRHRRGGWINTKENEEMLSGEARKLVTVINNKPIQM